MENPEIISFENEEKPKKNSISILDLYGEELTKKTYITNPTTAIRRIIINPPPDPDEEP